MIDDEVKSRRVRFKSFCHIFVSRVQEKKIGQNSIFEENGRVRKRISPKKVWLKTSNKDAAKIGTNIAGYRKDECSM